MQKQTNKCRQKHKNVAVGISAILSAFVGEFCHFRSR